LKKRSKKRLQFAVGGSFNTRPQMPPFIDKSFLVLFFKKERLSSLCFILPRQLPEKAEF